MRRTLFSFNLGIERLIFSSSVASACASNSFLFQSRNREAYLFKDRMLNSHLPVISFQSRNREAYLFKSAKNPAGQWLGITFQSRNREAYLFKYKCVRWRRRCYVVSISESRGLSFQGNRAVPTPFRLARFNLVIERLIFSSLGGVPPVPSRAGFNLVIERLIFSRLIGETGGIQGI